MVTKSQIMGAENEVLLLDIERFFLDPILAVIDVDDIDVDDKNALWKYLGSVGRWVFLC